MESTAKHFGRGEILWDSYGVPHIFGEDEEAVFFGFGWAQAQSHGNLLLRLYGEARGRAAEYWGETQVATDHWTLANGVPTRGSRWYHSMSASFRRKLDAFARGINEYARANGKNIAPEVAVVLPVTGVDVVSHAHRLFNYVYVAPQESTIGARAPTAEAGSNAWAVAPSKSASGHTLLLANPHLPWATGHFTYFEADLHGPDFQMYGATQVGLPVLRFVFNERMGFTHTVNRILGSTHYVLRPQGEGYLFDGAVLPFHTHTIRYQVRQSDGTLQSQELTVRASIHGPVFQDKEGRLIALRVAGLDRSGVLEQYWDMGKSTSFAEFEQILKRLQVPMFNIVYADKEGHIYYVNNGIVPKHSAGDLSYWSGLVPGDTSETLWNDLHTYEDLPKVVDPQTGWLQNSNDPPWFATYPPAIRHSDYPPYIAPAGPVAFRSQQSLRLLLNSGKIDFETLVERKVSTYTLMADRVLPDLIMAAEVDPDPEVRAAAALFKSWDRDTSADSRAALLFEVWAAKFSPNNFTDEANYRTRWSSSAPLDSPAGIADPSHAIELLKGAITDTKAHYGALDRAFGDVSRFRIKGRDFPGYGGVFTFNRFTWGPTVAGTRTPSIGETWTSLVEFSTPIKALGLMSYGNASQPGSPHRTDQLLHLAQRTFRTLWTTREQIEHHLEVRVSYEWPAFGDAPTVNVTPVVSITPKD